MAISYITGAASAGNSAGNITCDAGDFILVFAYRDGSTITPTLASGDGFTLGGSGTGNTNSATLGYKFATTSGSQSTGTWNNATGVVVMVWRDCAGLGAVSFATGSSNSIGYNALTRQIADGTSWGGRAAGHRTATNLTTNAPSTVPNTARVGVATECRGLDSNGPLGSNPTAATQSVNQTSGWESVTFELLAPTSTLIETLVDDFDTGSAPDAGNWPVQNGTPTLSGGQLLLAANGDRIRSSPGAFSLLDSSIAFQVHAVSGTGTISRLDGGVTIAPWSINPLTGLAYPGLVPASTVAHTPGNWYRVRESAGTLYYEYSTDGNSWTTLYSQSSTPQLGRVQADFRAVASGGTPTISAVVDNINVLPPSGLPVKVYLGGNWVTKPAKRWNGSAWVEFNPKIWDGSQWT